MITAGLTEIFIVIVILLMLKLIDYKQAKDEIVPKHWFIVTDILGILFVINAFVIVLFILANFQ